MAQLKGESVAGAEDGPGDKNGVVNGDELDAGVMADFGGGVSRDQGCVGVLRPNDRGDGEEL